GLDRLLLGVTMAEGDGRMFGATLPYDDVPSSAVDLAGRFAELIQRLSATLDRLTGRQPVSAWVDALITGTELLAVSASAEQWQRDQLRRVLAEVAEVAEIAGVAGGGDGAGPGEAGARKGGEAGAGAPPTIANAPPVLSLAEVRDLLDSRLQGR